MKKRIALRMLAASTLATGSLAKVQTEVDGKANDKWVKLIDPVPIPRQQNQ